MSEQTYQTPPAQPIDPNATPAPVDPSTAPPATTPPAATGYQPKARVGDLVSFDTVDPITNEALSGVGIVRGHSCDVDDNGQPVGAVRTLVTPLPNGYLLVTDDELDDLQA